LDIPDKQGNSALVRAVLNGRTQITEYLIKQGAQHDQTQLLHVAVSAGVTDRDIIPLLIDLGAQINEQNYAGQTPLTAAIAANNRVQVKLLIQNGADVNLANRADETPLALATKQGDQNIIRLLQANGAQ
jgi:ankyrin repeat protein